MQSYFQENKRPAVLHLNGCVHREIGGVSDDDYFVNNLGKGNMPAPFKKMKLIIDVIINAVQIDKLIMYKINLQ